MDSISCKKDSFLSKNLHFWSGFVGSSSSGWIRFKYAITIPSQTRKIAKASPQIVHCKDKMSYTVLTSHAGFPFVETNARTSKNQPINSLGKFLESQKENLDLQTRLAFRTIKTDNTTAKKPQSPAKHLTQSSVDISVKLLMNTNTAPIEMNAKTREPKNAQINSPNALLFFMFIFPPKPHEPVSGKYPYASLLKIADYK